MKTAKEILEERLWDQGFDLIGASDFVPVMLEVMEKYKNQDLLLFKEEIKKVLSGKLKVTEKFDVPFYHILKMFKTDKDFKDIDVGNYCRAESSGWDVDYWYSFIYRDTQYTIETNLVYGGIKFYKDEDY